MFTDAPSRQGTQPTAESTGQSAAESAAPGLREHKKDVTRRALAERALSLALERGFGGFTIAELVADVGVSRRTFSNYFSSKADCVAAVTDGWLDDVLDAIRHSDPSASLLEVLRTGLLAVAQQGTERWRTLQAVAEAEPELAGCMLAGDDAVAELVASEVARRTGLGEDDIRIKLLAGFAVTAGREVLTRWATESSGGNAELSAMLETAFSILNPQALAPQRC